MSLILAAESNGNTPYFALVITGLMAAIPSLLLYIRGGKDRREEAETKEKADNAIAQSTMTQQAFEGLKTQADAASAGHALCEKRCDELAQELSEARNELAAVRRELIDALANHAAEGRRALAAEQRADEALRRIVSLEQEIATLKDNQP